jgi:hypothetical protein
MSEHELRRHLENIGFAVWLSGLAALATTWGAMLGIHQRLDALIDANKPVAVEIEHQEEDR